MKTYTHALLAVAMTASFAGTALAESSDCTDMPRAKWMSMKAVKAQAVTMGYEVRGIKREGTCYEAKAIIKGKRRDVVINPATGKIVNGNEQN